MQYVLKKIKKSLIDNMVFIVVLLIRIINYTPLTIDAIVLRTIGPSVHVRLAI